MAKANGNHEQLLSSDYVTMNTNSMGGMSSNSMSTTFPSNHHLLVRHTAIDPLPSISHSQSQLNGGNSFELNGVTTSSLSEDSGLPLTTNSSISSGDSTRMGMCKFEFELATESDAEVSQFDSLENCSDGGMSAENFNTLKKVPLAPIDPPPEFQDSPQTTLTRSKTLQTTVLQGFSTKMAKNIVSTAITVINPNTMYDDISAITLKTKSLEILPTDTDTFYERHHSRKRNDFDDEPPTTHIYQCEYHSYHRGHNHDDYNHYHTYDIYASDSILNTHIDNIYDVPCDEYPTNSSCDSLLAAESSDQMFVFNETDDVIPVATTSASTNYRNDLHRMQMARANEIHDYEVYYRKRTHKAPAPKPASATTTEPCSSATSTLASDTIKSTPTTNRRSACDTLRTNTDTNHSKSSTLSSMAKAKTSSSSTSTSMTTFQHRKTPSILYSPLHYHANSNLSTGNRPNSRNSLNSRLSSSHNSLTISSSHKADDSTAFITQAMSHDALTSRDISDFYNVPIDSDIYALPIDVIRPISSGCASVAGSGVSKGAASGLSRSCIIRGALANAKGSAKILSDKIKAMPGPLQSMPSSNDMKQMPNNRTTLLLKNSTKRFRGRLKYVRNTKKRKRHQQLHAMNGGDAIGGRTSNGPNDTNERIDKRHSVPENGTVEPMRMTLEEVKRFYTNLYSSSSESALELSAITRNMSNANVCSHGGSNSGRLNKLAITTFNTFTSNKQSANVSTNNDNNNGNNNNNNNNNSININNNNTSKHNNNVSDPMVISDSDRSFNSAVVNNNNCTTGNNNNSTENCVGAAGGAIVNGKTSTATNTAVILQPTKLANGRNFKKIASSSSIAKESHDSTPTVTKKSQFSISLNLKQRFCSIFRFRKSYSTQHGANTAANHYGTSDMQMSSGGEKKMKFLTRALPPLPLSFKGLSTPDTPSSENSTEDNVEKREIKKPDPQNTMDFAKNIEKVKEYGWYWGPISSEAAEKLLSNEPDGSFIVRDSSDDHYIFSLTFKLNNCVRHVRIEQDQGTFSFGSCAKFKSRTIMEFIENAVESSRSGRYLFFFHRRPEHGPMRVQLTNPVSRFKHIQSLQHMCRFVIRRAVVRKDLIQTLPLPRRLLDYLSYKNCYSEQIESDSSQSPQPSEHIVRDGNDETDDNVIMQ